MKILIKIRKINKHNLLNMLHRQIIELKKLEKKAFVNIITKINKLLLKQLT